MVGSKKCAANERHGYERNHGDYSQKDVNASAVVSQAKGTSAVCGIRCETVKAIRTVRFFIFVNHDIFLYFKAFFTARVFDILLTFRQIQWYSVIFILQNFTNVGDA